MLSVLSDLLQECSPLSIVVERCNKREVPTLREAVDTGLVMRVRTESEESGTTPTPIVAPASTEVVTSLQRISNGCDKYSYS